MKKNYSKPEIVFESFKMTTSIASACGGIQANLGDKNECEVVEDGWRIFVSGNGECDLYSCYQVPESSTEIFGS